MRKPLSERFEGRMTKANLTEAQKEILRPMGFGGGGLVLSLMLNPKSKTTFSQALDLVNEDLIF